MIYLLIGPEEGEKLDWLEEEKRRLYQLYPDMECTTYFGGDEDGTKLSQTLSQSSLFASFRLVIFKHYENVKKTDAVARVMADFASDNQDDAELIVLSSETSTSSLPKEVVDKAKNSTLKFWEMDENKKRMWIRNNARKEGFSITNDAIEEILYSVDNNTAEMKNLLSSLILFLRLNDKSASSITLDSIETYISRTRGENGFTLFKAIAERNLEQSLLIASSILLNDTREAIPAFTTVANQFRLLESCLEMQAKRIPEREIFKNATYVSTSSYSRNIPGVFFKYQDTFRCGMRNYTLEDVRNIILYMGEMDSEIKSASTEMMKLMFETVIYDIIANKGKKLDITLEPTVL